MLDQYEINSSTLAILPVDDLTSKVLEEEAEYYVKKPTKDIIDDSCKYFGSSLKGRNEGTKSLIGGNYKLPVVIEETRDIIFFPTSSPLGEECAWISLNNLDDYKKQNKNSFVKFKNGSILNVDISIFSLENQILRASRLENVLRKRKVQ
jgi:competence protein ComK